MLRMEDLPEPDLPMRSTFCFLFLRRGAASWSMTAGVCKMCGCFELPDWERTRRQMVGDQRRLTCCTGDLLAPQNYPRVTVSTPTLRSICCKPSDKLLLQDMRSKGNPGLIDGGADMSSWCLICRGRSFNSVQLARRFFADYRRLTVSGSRGHYRRNTRIYRCRRRYKLSDTVVIPALAAFSASLSWSVP